MVVSLVWLLVEKKQWKESKESRMKRAYIHVGKEDDRRMVKES